MLDWRGRYQVISRRTIDCGKYLSWDALAACGGDDFMRDFLAVDFQAIFDRSWENLSAIHLPIYRELIYEFFSSYSFDADLPGHVHEGAVRFRLGGIFHELTLLEFATHVGLFTPEQTVGDIEHTMRMHLNAHTRTIPARFDYHAAWEILGRFVWRSGRNRETDIQDIRYRLLHRIIACTVAPRLNGQEKVTQIDLWMMHAFLPGSQRPDLPWFLARAFATVQSASAKTPLYLGHLVTALATSLGVVDATIIETLQPLDHPIIPIDMEHLRRMMVAHIAADGTTAWGQDPESDEEAPGDGGDDVHEAEEPAQPAPAEPPLVAPPAASVEERLARMEHERRRDFQYLSYELSRTHYVADWNRRMISEIASAHIPPLYVQPFLPPPPMDPSDPSPPGFDSWDAWWASRR